jgi:hypothetical protein
MIQVIYILIAVLAYFSFDLVTPLAVKWSAVLADRFIILRLTSPVLYHLLFDLSSLRK